MWGLPAETLAAVFKTIDVEDVKRVRHVCKTWNDLSTPFLLPTIHLSTQSSDREKLTQISQHPTLRKSVREIIYDSTVYDKHLLNRDHRRKNLGGSPRSCRANQTYSEEAVSRGHSAYKDAYAVQQALAQYCGPNLTRHTDNPFRPKKFKDMLFEPRSLDHVAEYLPDDLVRLVRALPLMPNVTRMTLSDRRWTSHKDLYRSLPKMSPYGGRQGFIFGLHNQGIPDLEQVIHYPQEWPCEHRPHYDKNHWRGFRVIAQALAMAKTHNVKHFSVQSGDEGTGLAWGVLADTLQESGLFGLAFQNLRSLDLKIDISHPETGNGYSVLFHGSLARGLASIQNLEQLSLGLNKSFIEQEVDAQGLESMSLAGLLGQHYWQHLHYVCFSDLMVSQQELLDFLVRHRQTLCHLVLSCVQFPGAEVLLDDDDEDEEDDVDEYMDDLSTKSDPTNEERLQDWYDYLRSLAQHELNLRSFSLSLENSTPRKERLWFHACSKEDVLQLLVSGGEDRHTFACTHDKEFTETKPLMRPRKALWMPTSTRILGYDGYV
ncbi:MAG: hypothetical protein Q9208_001381 [Pyrenodesmia sp. 3 TL-2023]